MISQTGGGSHTESMQGICLMSRCHQYESKPGQMCCLSRLLILPLHYRWFCTTIGALQRRKTSAEGGNEPPHWGLGDSTPLVVEGEPLKCLGFCSSCSGEVRAASAADCHEWVEITSLPFIKSLSCSSGCHCNKDSGPLVLVNACMQKSCQPQGQASDQPSVAGRDVV